MSARFKSLAVVPRPTTDEYFGGCPVCGRVDRLLNVGADHWFVCDADLTRWWIGTNLFSTWREDTPETWARNADDLRGFVEVKPVYPPDLGDAP
jgi:hypothetical protein